MKQVEMKDKIQKEYPRRTRKILETKLKSRNLIKGINTLAVPLVGIVTKVLLKGLEDLEVGGRVETIPTTTLLRTEKSPGNLRRLAVTQTPVKNNQLTLM